MSINTIFSCRLVCTLFNLIRQYSNCFRLACSAISIPSKIFPQMATHFWILKQCHLMSSVIIWGKNFHEWQSLVTPLKNPAVWYYLIIWFILIILQFMTIVTTEFTTSYSKKNISKYLNTKINIWLSPTWHTLTLHEVIYCIPVVTHMPSYPINMCSIIVTLLTIMMKVAQISLLRAPCQLRYNKCTPQYQMIIYN